MINSLLKNLPADSLKNLYDSAVFFRISLMLLGIFLYIRHYFPKKRQAVSYGVVFCTAYFLVAFTLPSLAPSFGLTIPNYENNRMWVLLLICLVMSRFWNLSPLNGADAVIPGILLGHAGGRVGCVLFGCCSGVPCNWGIYSPIRGELVFPIPLLDMLGSIAIAIFVMLYTKRHHYKANGKAFGVSMVLYGTMNYALELGTKEIFNKKSVYALVLVLVGLVTLYLSGQKNTTYA